MTQTYPYTYARMSVMKSRLFTKETYHKLLKMDVNSIANFLGETEYKPAIDALGAQWSGITLLEKALGLHLAQIIEKIQKISPGTLHAMLEVYSKRWDYENIKTLLRGRTTQTPTEEIKHLLTLAGTWNTEKRTFLLKQETPEAVLDATGHGDLKKYLTTKDTPACENALDEQYYEEVLSFAKKEGFLTFYSIMRHEIDMINLLSLLHKKIQGTTSSFFITGGHFSLRTLQQLSQDSLPSILDALQKKGWLDQHINTLRDIEIALIHAYLQKTKRLIHTKPLKADIIFGYLFAKEIEIKNVQMIMKGKSLHIKEDILEVALA